MKTKILIYLMSAVLPAMLFFSCSDNDENVEKESYKVEITQSGDYKNFDRLLTVTGNAIYDNLTGKQISSGKLNEEMMEQPFISISTMKPESAFIVGGAIVATGNGEGEMHLEIVYYKGGKIMEERKYSYKKGDNAITFSLSY